ncbi:MULTISPECIES: hypothetical protein [unclassified Ensifer]|uniref:hypothetical protein n=1 Tax=unclassified Ensifer TaxID=2633371 RepID=UPI00081345C5|nr:MULTISPECIES: hypothetical protein [unclassified Ensifer]OCP07988.1 hypothetical protein BC362_10280 [Ensifer sp. LC14]OCP10902.1 hypothetical protein BC374_17685 [Ensifer sp. LC13]OCP11552.1 hypothetical protein BBX50_18170 [Ensifer sp. LC11]OCP33371.1 hypothetical protein BC364_17060 [Ensifer sp. LC499]
MMTPRQIVHRFQVHHRLKQRSDIRDLEIAVLGARGEQKALTGFINRRSGGSDSSGSQSAKPDTIPELETKRVSTATASRLDREIEDMGWSKR